MPRKKKTNKTITIPPKPPIPVDPSAGVPVLVRILESIKRKDDEFEKKIQSLNDRIELVEKENIFLRTRINSYDSVFESIGESFSNLEVTDSESATTPTSVVQKVVSTKKDDEIPEYLRKNEPVPGGT